MKRSEMDRFVKDLVRTGKWELISSNKHFKLKFIETGTVLICPTSPSDGRSMLNIMNKIKHIEEGNEELYLRNHIGRRKKEEK